MSNDILLIIATILWGIWGIANKYAVLNAHPFTVTWMFSVPSLLLIPLWFWLGSRASPATALDRTAFAWAALASLTSIAATTLLFFVMQRQPASLAVAAVSAYPLVTLAIGVLTGIEKFSPQRLVGIVVIIVGVVLVQSSSG
jgi:drug/metabolite transporter (DMT)-like permease